MLNETFSVIFKRCVYVMFSKLLTQPLFIALHLARVFSKAGHEVILAAKDDYHGYSLPYFSKHVHTFVSLNDDKSVAQYGEKLLRLWYFNNVDWFVPIISDTNYEGIFDAVERLKNCAAKKNRIYQDLILNHSV